MIANALRIIAGGLLALLLFSTTACGATEGKRRPADRGSQLRHAGYSELSGANAARFLVGNSVMMREPDYTDSDGPPAMIRTTYYFLDEHTMYECGATSDSNCFVGYWTVKGNEICLIFICKPFDVFQSPHAKVRRNHSGKLGILLTYAVYSHEIVKGKRVDAPRFDLHTSARAIELPRAELNGEVKDEGKSGEADKISISGARATSLLVGNTFLLDDAATSSKDPAMKTCPARGTYYSPDGRIVEFTCDGWPHILTMWISHWRIEAGRFCREDREEIGAFGCNDAGLTAIPAPGEAGTGDKMIILDIDGEAAYAGNVLNFDFGDHSGSPRSRRKSSRIPRS
jgi:hypothetical protein